MFTILSVEINLSRHLPSSNKFFFIPIKFILEVQGIWLGLVYYIDSILCCYLHYFFLKRIWIKETWLVFVVVVVVESSFVFEIAFAHSLFVRIIVDQLKMPYQTTKTKEEDHLVNDSEYDVNILKTRSSTKMNPK